MSETNLMTVEQLGTDAEVARATSRQRMLLDGILTDTGAANAEAVADQATGTDEPDESEQSDDEPDEDADSEPAVEDPDQVEPPTQEPEPDEGAE